MNEIKANMQDQQTFPDWSVNESMLYSGVIMMYICPASRVGWFSPAVVCVSALTVAIHSVPSGPFWGLVPPFARHSVV